jgi:hypothetical protein
MAVARITSVIASSSESWEEAAKEAMVRASKTLRGITGMEVMSQKAKVHEGKITEYRIEVKITFILDS